MYFLKYKEISGNLAGHGLIIIAFLPKAGFAVLDFILLKNNPFCMDNVFDPLKFYDELKAADVPYKAGQSAD